MTASLLLPPQTDPTPIFELFRGNLATELLTAAVVHFRVFERFGDGPLGAEDLRAQLELARRPFVVLTTALRAFGLLHEPAAGLLDLTPLAREHLRADSLFDVSGYIGLAGESPGVVALVERLRSNKPAGAQPHEKGTAFIYRDGAQSAMEQEAEARRLTLSLAGRARNVAPSLAQRVPLESARLLLDVGGGSGLYSIACLQRNPRLRAIVWDRPEVLKVAQELADAHQVADRLECRPGDMFSDPVPGGAEAILLSNVLHDWDEPECLALLERCAAALPAGGRVFIHDVFLNDARDGPLPLALYSVALFVLTEGRAYSAAEYHGWLMRAGLAPGEVVPTLIHCGVLAGKK